MSNKLALSFRDQTGISEFGVKKMTVVQCRNAYCLSEASLGILAERKAFLAKSA